MDDIQQIAPRITCSKGHAVCAGCLVPLVRVAAARSPAELTDREVTHRTVRVYCPLRGHGCSSWHYDRKKQLRPLLRGTVAWNELKKAKKVMREASEDASDPEYTLRMLRRHFRRRDGSYAAYQCSTCGFGPVSHTACANLETHHNETRGANGRVRNDCPNCGHFHRDIHEWSQWDGKLYGAAAEAAHSCTGSPATAQDNESKVQRVARLLDVPLATAQQVVALGIMEEEGVLRPSELEADDGHLGPDDAEDDEEALEPEGATVATVDATTEARAATMPQSSAACDTHEAARRRSSMGQWMTERLRAFFCNRDCDRRSWQLGVEVGSVRVGV